MFSKEMEAQIELLCSKLSRRQIKGSLEVTIETSKLLRNVIAGSRWNDPDSLTFLVKEVQIRLTEAQPIEFSSEHTARRILNLIHDDTMEWDRREEEEETSFRDAIKNSILQEISEIMDEAESANSHIASQALEHIHSNEIIMTVGYSKIILNFLKEANKYRKFQVIMAENAPFYDGQTMAAELAKSGIETTVVTDSAVFAVMSRVNKVLLDAHAVSGDGGLIACSGSHVLAGAAKHHSKPVVVCAGVYSLAPFFLLNDTDSYKLCISPESVYSFQDCEKARSAELANPFYDFVEASLLSLIITESGPHPPSNLSRIFDQIAE